MSRELLRNLRAVIFDFDGTLAETEIDFDEMRRRTREHIRQWGLWEEGMGERRYVLELIEHAELKLPDDPARRQQYRAEAAQILEDVEMLTCPQAAPFPGTVEALSRLRACGYAIGIVTRNCHRGVQAVTDRHHLPYDVLLTRDDVEKVKPDPAHVHEALERLDVSPGETIMVGDHITDIQVGKAVGMVTCGVLTAAATNEELEAAGADLVLDDVAALGALLCSDHR